MTQQHSPHSPAGGAAQSRHPDHHVHHGSEHTTPSSHDRHEEHNGHGGHGGHRTHKFDPARLERLLGDERRRQMPPEDTLRAAGVMPGHTVVDLGCGPGYFTLPAASLVGDSGYIYAVDVQRELLDICRRRVDEAGLTNVETVHSEESRVPLPDACADLVFAAFVLHETDAPAAFLREAARLLKPGGAAVIVEWQKRDEPAGPPSGHRLSVDEVLAHARDAGLQAAEQYDLNERHYLVGLRLSREAV